MTHIWPLTPPPQDVSLGSVNSLILSGECQSKRDPGGTPSYQLDWFDNGQNIVYVLAVLPVLHWSEQLDYAVWLDWLDLQTLSPNSFCVLG